MCIWDRKRPNIILTGCGVLISTLPHPIDTLHPTLLQSLLMTVSRFLHYWNRPLHLVLNTIPFHAPLHYCNKPGGGISHKFGCVLNLFYDDPNSMKPKMGFPVMFVIIVGASTLLYPKCPFV